VVAERLVDARQMSETHYLGAVEAMRLFRAAALSPVELMEAVIARAATVEPTVNALCHRHFDEALELARRAESRYAGRGEPPRPLEGLPIAIKDSMPVTGRPWSRGSLLCRGEIAEQTTPVAERIADAGGIIHARTTTPEFSSAAFTHSRLWGVTRNPWNPEQAAGGSSGGAAAALASGTTSLAPGTDIGGSIRVPASLCGVVGYKPPYGRVPLHSPINLDRYCHAGPLARDVADCLLLQNVLAGPHPADAASLHPRLEIPSRLAPVDGLRVALSPDLGDWPLDPEVRANTLAAGDALRAAGAFVEEVPFALPRADVLRAVAIHWREIFSGEIRLLAEQDGDVLTRYALELVRWCEERAAGGSELDGLKLEAGVQAALAELFERYDVLVCATAGTRGLAAGDDYVGTELTVGGERLSFYLEGFLTTPFNIASRCPVLSVPSGFADNGVPTGIQIVGRPYDDATVFRVAAAYERAFPWSVSESVADRAAL
jgi:aspartyl-tRNA(Asn)/glutamyl-tRNA(Gln) amidotransferase subunit A